jgi:hypothetical protein
MLAQFESSSLTPVAPESSSTVDEAPTSSQPSPTPKKISWAELKHEDFSFRTLASYVNAWLEEYATQVKDIPFLNKDLHLKQATFLSIPILIAPRSENVQRNTGSGVFFNANSFREMMMFLGAVDAHVCGGACQLTEYYFFALKELVDQGIFPEKLLQRVCVSKKENPKQLMDLDLDFLVRLPNCERETIDLFLSNLLFHFSKMIGGKFSAETLKKLCFEKFAFFNNTILMTIGRGKGTLSDGQADVSFDCRIRFISLHEPVPEIPSIFYSNKAAVSLDPSKLHRSGIKEILDSVSGGITPSGPLNRGTLSRTIYDMSMGGAPADPSFIPAALAYLLKVFHSHAYAAEKFVDGILKHDKLCSPVGLLASVINSYVILKPLMNEAEWTIWATELKRCFLEKNGYNKALSPLFPVGGDMDRLEDYVSGLGLVSSLRLCLRKSCGFNNVFLHGNSHVQERLSAEFSVLLPFSIETTISDTSIAYFALELRDMFTQISELEALDQIGELDLYEAYASYEKRKTEETALLALVCLAAYKKKTSSDGFLRESLSSCSLAVCGFETVELQRNFLSSVSRLFPVFADLPQQFQVRCSSPENCLCDLVEVLLTSKLGEQREVAFQLFLEHEESLSPVNTLRVLQQMDAVSLPRFAPIVTRAAKRMSISPEEQLQLCEKMAESVPEMEAKHPEELFSFLDLFFMSKTTRRDLLFSTALKACRALSLASAGIVEEYRHVFVFLATDANEFAVFAEPMERLGKRRFYHELSEKMAWDRMARFMKEKDFSAALKMALSFEERQFTEEQIRLFEELYDHLLSQLGRTSGSGRAHESLRTLLKERGGLLRGKTRTWFSLISTCLDSKMPHFALKCMQEDFREIKRAISVSEREVIIYRVLEDIYSFEGEERLASLFMLMRLYSEELNPQFTSIEGALTIIASSLVGRNEFSTLNDVLNHFETKNIRPLNSSARLAYLKMLPEKKREKLLLRWQTKGLLNDQAYEVLFSLHREAIQSLMPIKEVAAMKTMISHYSLLDRQAPRKEKQVLHTLYHQLMNECVPELCREHAEEIYQLDLFPEDEAQTLRWLTYLETQVDTNLDFSMTFLMRQNCSSLKGKSKRKLREVHIKILHAVHHPKVPLSEELKAKYFSILDASQSSELLEDRMDLAPSYKNGSKELSFYTETLLRQHEQMKKMPEYLRCWCFVLEKVNEENIDEMLPKIHRFVNYRGKDSMIHSLVGEDELASRMEELASGLINEVAEGMAAKVFLSPEVDVALSRKCTRLIIQTLLGSAVRSCKTTFERCKIIQFCLYFHFHIPLEEEKKQSELHEYLYGSLLIATHALDTNDPIWREGARGLLSTVESLMPRLVNTSDPDLKVLRQKIDSRYSFCQSKFGIKLVSTLENTGNWLNQTFGRWVQVFFVAGVGLVWYSLKGGGCRGGLPPPFVD